MDRIKPRALTTDREMTMALSKNRLNEIEEELARIEHSLNRRKRALDEERAEWKTSDDEEAPKIIELDERTSV
jgi:hypothetical protein